MSATGKIGPAWARYVQARETYRTGAGLPPNPTDKERAALGVALVNTRSDFSQDACQLLASAMGCAWTEMAAALREGLR